MSDFLDRLAMEISEWPKLSEFPSWMPLGRIDSAAHWEKQQTTGMWLIYKRNKLGESGAPITEDEWRQRRAALINEPDVSAAPEWAKWVAQDADGNWHWFELMPKANCSSWVRGGVVCDTRPSLSGPRGRFRPAAAGASPAGHDWRNTLTKIIRFTPDLTPKEVVVNGVTSDSRQDKSALFASIAETVSFIDLAKDEEAKHLLIDHLERLLDLRLHGLEQD